MLCAFQVLWDQTKKHPIAAVAIFALWTFPQWLSSVWSLYSSESLFEWASKKGVHVTAGILWMIVLPAGFFIAAFVVISEIVKKQGGWYTNPMLTLSMFLIGGNLLALGSFGVYRAFASRTPRVASLDHSHEPIDTPKVEGVPLKSNTEQTLENKYRWGYRIFGVDKFGGVVTYTNRISKEYDFNWDKIEITASVDNPRYKVIVPPFRVLNTNNPIVPSALGGGEVGGDLKIGAGGGFIAGDIYIAVEILNISNDSVSVLVGLNESDVVKNIMAFDKRLKPAEAVISRFQDLFNKEEFDTIWKEAHPDFRAAGEQQKVMAVLKNVRANGKILSSERIIAGPDHVDGSNRFRVDMKINFEKGAAKAAFTVKETIGGASLFGVGFSNL